MLQGANEPEVFLDGAQWCAVRPGFTNLQECPAGFGATPDEAIQDLIRNEESET